MLRSVRADSSAFSPPSSNTLSSIISSIPVDHWVDF
uniref:Uncharacterized protein n=1 Tax=Rhizophora mucronata TaxID=61149 RepID=A0A2P2PLB6_RHIMU